MPRRLSAVLTAFVLGLSLAACGGDDNTGGRENVERSNQGETGQGPTTVETGPTTLGSTGEDQPQVDQTETGP
ncbi:MAG TPA: hypothetical protein VF587_03630 [Solirubrobacteraceae bacterium]|jgi:hypothetical protein